MKTFNKTYVKHNSCGCDNVAIYEEDNAAKLNILFAVKIAENIAAAHKETDGKILRIAPNAEYFIYEVGIKNPSHTMTISIFPVGKEAGVLIKTQTELHTKTEWLTPEKLEEYNFYPIWQDE